MTNATNYLGDSKIWKQPEILDEDMRPSDLVDTLKRLKFDEQYCLIWLDRPVGDYLVAALTDPRRR